MTQSDVKAILKALKRHEEIYHSKDKSPAPKEEAPAPITRSEENPFVQGFQDIINSKGDFGGIMQEQSNACTIKEGVIMPLFMTGVHAVVAGSKDKINIVGSVEHDIATNTLSARGRVKFPDNKNPLLFEIGNRLPNTPENQARMELMLIMSIAQTGVKLSANPEGTPFFLKFKENETAEEIIAKIKEIPMVEEKDYQTN